MRTHWGVQHTAVYFMEYTLQWRRDFRSILAAVSLLFRNCFIDSFGIAECEQQHENALVAIGEGGESAKVRDRKKPEEQHKTNKKFLGSNCLIRCVNKKVN